MHPPGETSRKGDGFSLLGLLVHLSVWCSLEMEMSPVVIRVEFKVEFKVEFNASALEVLAIRMLVFLQGLKKQCLCTTLLVRVILIISETAEVQRVARSLALFLHTSPDRAEM